MVVVAATVAAVVVVVAGLTVVTINKRSGVRTSCLTHRVLKSHSFCCMCKNAACKIEHISEKCNRLTKYNNNNKSIYIVP